MPEKKAKSKMEKPKREAKKDKELGKPIKEVKKKEKIARETAEKKTEIKKEAKPIESEFNPWDILRYPHLAEKSMNMVEIENKLVFIVDRRAKKDDIIEAVERGFNVVVDSVNTEITRKNQKKAYIKLAPQYSASDIASRLGMI